MKYAIKILKNEIERIKNDFIEFKKPYNVVSDFTLKCVADREKGKVKELQSAIELLQKAGDK